MKIQCDYPAANQNLGSHENSKTQRSRKKIHDTDLMRFAKGLEELHNLMQKFMLRKCTNKEERKRILELHSAEELIEKLDEQPILEKLSDKEKEQS